MSRCFPFPPPAYANKGPSFRTALVELNEPQKEEEEARIQMKKEKKLKLRKESELNEKMAHSRATDEKLVETKDEKKRFQRGKSADLKAKYPSKKVYDESEQLEKSDLTEEHEQPTVSSVCYLSDGTQSSNKRKRQDSAVNGSGNPEKRIIVRIKLPSRKQTESDFSTIAQGKNCCSMGHGTHTQDRTALGHIPRGEPLCHTNEKTKAEPEQLKPCVESPLSAPETKTGTEKKTSSSLNSVESAYKTLIENWVPDNPIHQFWQEAADDQDWLFGLRKQQDKQGFKRRKADIEESGLMSSMLLPRAQFLFETDIWALPYTIPF